MRKDFPMRLLPALSAGLLMAFGQEARPDLKTNLCTRGKLLFSDGFAGKELSKEWKVAKGKWEVADQALKGSEVAADRHAAVLKHPIEFRNLVLQFSFKFEGAKRASLSMDGKGRHVCRVTLTPQGFTLQKDGTKDGTDKPAQVGKGVAEFKAGEWHTMLVEVLGKEMLAQVDDKVFAFGENAGIELDKASIGFPVSGESFVVDDVRIWEATPNAEWAANKQKLAAAR